MDIEQAFGMTLRHYRKEARLSQEELAHRCELDRTFISLLERGLRRPTLNTIFALSKSVGITPTRLVNHVEKLLADES